MDRIRAVLIAGVMIYAGYVAAKGQSVGERVSLQGQQIGDAIRRVEVLERLEVGARLARIETQMEMGVRASERSANLSTGALLCLLTLLGERIFSLFRGENETDSRTDHRRGGHRADARNDSGEGMRG